MSPARRMLKFSESEQLLIKPGPVPTLNKVLSLLRFLVGESIIASSIFALVTSTG